MEQTVTVARDGSADIVFRYSVAERLLPVAAEGQRLIQTWQGRNSARTPAGRLDWFLNRQAVERHFSNGAVRMESYRTYEQDGRRHVVVECKTGDIRAAFREGSIGEFQLAASADDRETVTLKARLARTERQNELSEQTKEELAALASGCRIRLKIVIPTPVVETTAHESGERSATWVFDADRDAEFLYKTPDVHVSFRRDGLAWAPR